MSRLNYHHLYYFWRVAVIGNLTQAAKNLHVSQSALSAQIRQLEDTLDVKLFDRVGRALVLTETGRRVLVYAQDIFSKGQELESLLRRGEEPTVQTLRIGVLSTMSRNFVEAFVSPLMGNPNVRFTLNATHFDNLLNGLGKHQFDLVLSNISATLGTGAGIDGEHLWQSQLLARQPVSIVGPAHLKPETRFPIGYTDKSWILPGRNSDIRTAFEGFCALVQFEPKVQAETDDMAMLRLLARDSGSLAVLPAVVVRDEIQNGVLVEYMTIPNLYEHFYAITVKRQFVPAIVGELLSRPLQQVLQ
ncbi:MULTISPECIES: LysR family transcriptional regulator [unclassified Pusillimonas]|uniref:LysR family transcriptional regulator n=1 Tax=unclassified Pusillimonas TaxID=2640016 RepID=UPI000B9D3028|nr:MULTISPECIES: LysR family transcriptional regulator [unclassified Pusillimonas]OXR50326.1 LysR family transcriptional regulator [Pusillimonas sp. T2]ROT44702.1 LysR family transcriptional regulator [Pusillimonas sp. NJUB218]